MFEEFLLVGLQLSLMNLFGDRLRTELMHPIRPVFTSIGGPIPIDKLFGLLCYLLVQILAVILIGNEIGDRKASLDVSTLRFAGLAIPMGIVLQYGFGDLNSMWVNSVRCSS